MHINSDRFRATHNITYRANIELFLDTDIMRQGGHYGVWDSDTYIDTNQNGIVDTEIAEEKTMFKSLHTTEIKEPILRGGMKPLRSSAKSAEDSEVVCLENSREHFVEDVTCHTRFAYGGFEGSTFRRTNQRSLTQLARELTDSDSARWAVDLKTGEFLVYEAAQN